MACARETMRLKMLMDITKPLRRLVKVQLSELTSEKRIAIKYERLPYFCYSCGIIGHHKLGWGFKALQNLLENSQNPSNDQRFDSPKKCLLHLN